LLIAGEVPEQRALPERIEAYCAYLDGKVKPTTIYSRLTEVAPLVRTVFPLR
jgi:hypothetical protein